MNLANQDAASRHDFLRRSRGNRQPGCVVTWDDYCRINAREERDGHEVGKPREKLVTFGDLYSVAEGRLLEDQQR